MAIEKIHINHFIELSKTCLVLDVRSPGEYNHAHIPGVVSLPLFTDEERKIVGTAYKQESREKAIKIGLNYFGNRMIEIVEKVESLVNSSLKLKQNNTATHHSVPVIVHCWRGGMRSAGMAWLLDLYGFKVYTLIGGYKAYRGWIREQFSKTYHIHILGGYTGSGKTKILHALAAAGQTVIDLESLASHKGSAFGKIGMNPQPSQEMFENLLGSALFFKAAILENPVIWIEDESQRIGDVMIPADFWKQMRKSRIFFLRIPFEERLAFLVHDYSQGQTEEFINAINRIKKRLGGAEAKAAVECLLRGEMKEAFSILLTYYDKYYKKALNKRDNINQLLVEVPCGMVAVKKTADMLLELSVCTEK